MFIFSERLKEPQVKDVTYGNVKSHKKPGLHLLSRRYILGETFSGPSAPVF